MQSKKRPAIALFILAPAVLLIAQKISFDFVDQKYGDVLYALSSYRGIPIVADDTVAGTVSFQFAGTGFEGAFDSFLLSNRLYALKEEKRWTVSRIRMADNPADGTLSLDALDATPAQILERLSRSTGRTIIFDVLPSARISIHILSASPEEIASMVMKPFPGFSVETAENCLHVKKNAEVPPQGTNTMQAVPQQARLTIEHSDGKYSVQAGQARLSEVVDRLCREENTGYSNFMKNDPVLSGITLTGKDFAETMELILELAGGESFDKNGIRYIVPSLNPDTAKKLRDGRLAWKEYGLRNIRFREAQISLSARFPLVLTVPLADPDRFLAAVDEKTAAELDVWLEQIDVEANSTLIKLKYVSTSDLYKTLPPSIRKEELSDTGTGTSFFYTGPEGSRDDFIGELREIDRPKKRIRYDMLIIQYEKSANLAWNPEADVRQLKPGDMTSVSGTFGSLLNLNFDVITLFGYRFSARLNAALAENRAQVFTDTTLHGISGENIKFQNTSTYRYRDSNIDPETGKPVYTGVTREIVSGVVLELNGWVSGDGMVTMNIHASVSKRGADVSSQTANPPPTSEKSITTKLSAADGEPVILSGLTQNDSGVTGQRLPFISRIPVIGLFFRSVMSTSEKTEMVIYIVPHVTNTREETGAGDGLEKTALERLVPEGEEGR